MPRLAGALAALGDRFPEETKNLMAAFAPALAGRARRRWVRNLVGFSHYLRRALGGGPEVAGPPSCWLRVAHNDLSIYCGLQPNKTRRGETRGDGSLPTPRADEQGRLPNLHWNRLKADLLEQVAGELHGDIGDTWRALVRWTRGGFPLHYSGPARKEHPVEVAHLMQASRHTVDQDLEPLQQKLCSLLVGGGPTFGPFRTPPYDLGIVSPVLGVWKKDGTVRPVYHCSYPRDKQGSGSRRSLNGGIQREDFWFPTYDSVAAWILQWYLCDWSAGPVITAETPPVIFKLDFESAFRQVPVRESDWPLLMLLNGSNQSYMLETCAAFGTRISADLWLRVANIWKFVLHACGFPVTMIYVDDLAVICPGARLRHLFRLVSTLEHELGTRVHWGKVFSDGGCTTCATVLGVLVDTRERTLSLDPKKARQRLNQIRVLLNTTRWEVKGLEKLVGALNFFATALPSGRLLLGPLYALTGLHGGLVDAGPHHAARLALSSWHDILRSAIQARVWLPMFHNLRSVHWLATDASDAGLGGVSAFGAWSSSLSGRDAWSINVRELLAVWVSITKVWRTQLRHSLLHVFVDNETARSWAGHPPSGRVAAPVRHFITAVQRDLALCLQDMDCTLVMHRIPTHDNYVADRLSRYPDARVGRTVLLDWRNHLANVVDQDKGARDSLAWLAKRDWDTPLLWWETKPTSLSPSAPLPLRSLFPGPDADPNVFTRRPLLLSLMQPLFSGAWAHLRLGEEHVARWWNSISGLQGRDRDLTQPIASSKA